MTTGKKYFYSVSAYKGLKRHKVFKKIAISLTPELDTPKLKVSTKKGKVKLNIQEVDGATGYEIYRDNKKITDQTDTTFVDEEIKADETYRYSVKAYRDQTEEPGDEENDQADEQAEDKKVLMSAPEQEGEAEQASESKEDSKDESKDNSKEDSKEDSDNTITAYSDMSNQVKAKLVTVSKMDAEITGNNLTLTWEPSEKYKRFKLYRNDKLLIETTNNSYTIENFDPEGEYSIRLVGFTADGKTKSPERNQEFKITEEGSSNEEAINAACEWGEDIAANDEFTYGECPRALHYGCYFCGTNLRKKGTALQNGHSYEKTYICNALIHACYAHGAGDPAMLAACQSGSGIGMTEASFTRYGNWSNQGRPSMDNLQRGDVLVANKSMGSSKLHHVAMYLGDGMILQATRKNWTPESIAVSKLSSSYYSRFDFVMRYTGNGGGFSYSVEDVTPKE